jgi:hypothetical protein
MLDSYKRRTEARNWLEIAVLSGLEHYTAKDEDRWQWTLTQSMMLALIDRHHLPNTLDYTCDSEWTNPPVDTEPVKKIRSKYNWVNKRLKPLLKDTKERCQTSLSIYRRRSTKKKCVIRLNSFNRLKSCKRARKKVAIDPNSKFVRIRDITCRALSVCCRIATMTIDFLM